MKIGYYQVILLLTFGLLSYNDLPECTHSRTIPVGNLDTSQIPQISEGYFSASSSSALVKF